MRKTNFMTAAQAAWMDWTTNNLPSFSNQTDNTAVFLSDLDCIIRSKPNFEGYTCVKLLEIKARLQKPQKVQKITLGIINAGLRRLDGETIILEGVPLKIKYYGFHLLQFSGTGVKDSEQIIFDNELISEKELIYNLSWGCCSGCFN